MKDNLQNIADLIGALAEDIEEIKKKLDAKDSPDKDEALKRLAVKLEPVIRFFSSSTPENINAIFGSQEAIEDYKKSLGDEMVVSLRLYTDANDKDMRKRGIDTTKDLLAKILELLTSHMENDRQASQKTQPRQGFISGLWQAIRQNKALNANRRLKMVVDKHQVTTVMLNELHPGLAVTIRAYEKLTETVGVDSTLTIFREQVKTAKKESKNRNK